MNPNEPSPLLRFGIFELDLESGELRKAGRRLRLGPQPFRILAYLAARPGRAVGRQELIEHVWNDGTVVDFDGSLNSALKRIRAALDDPADAPRWIETLPRVGYRFLGPVERLPERATPTRRVGLPALAGVLGLVLVAAVWMLRDGAPGGGAGTSRPAASEAQPSPLALDAFFKGRFILNGTEPDAPARAAARFREALRHDPGYAPARAALAEALVREALAAGGEAIVPGLERAEPEAERAVRDDPDLPDALSARARVRLHLRRDGAGAEADLRHALELAPDDGALHNRLAFLLGALGRHDEALAASARARALAPLDPGVQLDAAWLHFHARRYEGAVAESLRALELQPGFLPASYCLSQAYRMLDRREEALAASLAMLPAAGADPAEVEALRALPLEERGAAIVAWWRDPARDSLPLPDYDRALLLVREGRHEEALEVLAGAVRRREPATLSIAVDPRLDPLRGRPELSALIRSWQPPPGPPTARNRAAPAGGTASGRSSRPSAGAAP